jgi:fatty-acyl-CoA synthase
VELDLAGVHEAIAAVQPAKACIVTRDRRLTWGDVTERTRRLASLLHGHGLGCHRERAELECWESGQDHLALYLHNGPEYLEGMLGAYKARVAPFNVNYRYVAEELRSLLLDAQPAAMVLHSAFAPTLAAVLSDLPPLRLLLQVPDCSGEPLLPGAEWYEDALAAAPPVLPPVTPSPDDLFMIYTGGTTGRPKGVLWRQSDAITELIAGPADRAALDAVLTGPPSCLRVLPAPPLMHGASQIVSFNTWMSGGTVCLPDHPERLDPADIWRVIERERMTSLVIVGDAFARPLLDDLERADYDLSSLVAILTGGAPLSKASKAEFQRRLPAVMIVDGLAASEAGGHARHVLAGGPVTSGRFTLSPGNTVLDLDLRRELFPGEPQLGWLAKRGRMALGYLNDPCKTAATFPTIDGVRYCVPGDCACLLADGTIELLGRDTATINSGGEKVFAEEVEEALKGHPAVYDCVVAGRPSERWGSEVVAVVRLRRSWLPGPDTEAALLADAGSRLARYKLPKAFVFVDDVQRAPSGKADYRWAAELAAKSA